MCWKFEIEFLERYVVCLETMNVSSKNIMTVHVALNFDRMLIAHPEEKRTKFSALFNNKSLSRASSVRIIGVTCKITNRIC